MVSALFVKVDVAPIFFFEIEGSYLLEGLVRTHTRTQLQYFNP